MYFPGSYRIYLNNKSAQTYFYLYLQNLKYFKTMSDQISFSSNRNTIQKFKVVLVGDQNVGKSSIIARYIRNQFDPTKNPTIGIDFISKNICVSGKMVRLQLWDTAGQQRFKSLIPSYLKDAHLAIVVFDLTNLSSVENLPKWIDFVREVGRTEAKIYVVGNKSDMDAEIQPETRKMAQETAEKQAEFYKQVSAKTNANIEDLFNEILEELVTSNIKKKEVALTKDNSEVSSKQEVAKDEKISLNKKSNAENQRGGCCSK